MLSGHSSGVKIVHVQIFIAVQLVVLAAEGKTCLLFGTFIIGFPTESAIFWSYSHPFLMLHFQNCNPFLFNPVIKIQFWSREGPEIVPSEYLNISP